jgi:hypothetical protein
MSGESLQRLTDAALSAGGKSYILPFASCVFLGALVAETKLIPAEWQLWYQWPLYVAFLWNVAKMIGIQRAVKRGWKKLGIR